MSQSQEYTITELRAMPKQEARSTLTVDQYERWEKLNQLHDQAEEQREQWASEDAQVEDIVVHADPEELGTRVDLYGNDILVRVDPEDEDYREIADTIDDEYGDIHTDDIDDLGEEDAERLIELFTDLLAECLVEWNGHTWSELTPGQREMVRGQWREKWGAEGIVLGKIQVLGEVESDREERMGVVEKFRPETRGRRR